MGIIIDVIILLLILISTYLGYRKGLVSLAVSFIAFIAAIIITVILYRPIGNLIINNTKFDENLQTTIQEKVEDVITKDGEGNGIANGLVESAKQGVLPNAARTIAVNVIYGITMIILFVVARLALLLINLLADTIAKLPILNQFNKGGGILYGLLRGLIITYLIVMIINLIIVFNPNGLVGKAVQQTFLTKIISEYNVLNILL